MDPAEAGEIVSPYTNGAVDPETTQELDVQETIVLEERDPEILRTLLVGTPSPASRLHANGAARCHSSGKAPAQIMCNMAAA